jgi:alpha-tubulin suppressor-like RCC1 family protein
VAGGHIFSAISAGFNHTCAIAAGNGPDAGEVYCWGDNTYGELGIGVTNPTYVAQPTAVSIGVAGVAFRSVSAGYWYTCAATGGQPSAANAPAGYCWGRDDVGQLGLGSVAGIVSFIANPMPVVEPPVRVGPPLLYSSIIAGGYGPFSATHTCGLLTTGEAFCWGSNAIGELGNVSAGATSLDPVPVTDAVGNPLAFTQIGVGGDVSCGLATSQLAFCWGSNAEGQLGNNTSSGNPAFSPIPSAVQGNLNFSAIAVGADSACAEQNQPSATLYCWGYNEHGELGNGLTSFDSAVPVMVSGNHQFTQFSVGWGVRLRRRRHGDLVLGRQLEWATWRS